MNADDSDRDLFRKMDRDKFLQRDLDNIATEHDKR